MKKIINHQHPRKEYRFDIVGHKKALKIWLDSTFKQLVKNACRKKEARGNESKYRRINLLTD